MGRNTSRQQEIEQNEAAKKKKTTRTFSKEDKEIMAARHFTPRPTSRTIADIYERLEAVEEALGIGGADEEVTEHVGGNGEPQEDDSE